MKTERTLNLRSGPIVTLSTVWNPAGRGFADWPKLIPVESGPPPLTIIIRYDKIRYEELDLCSTHCGKHSFFQVYKVHSPVPGPLIVLAVPTTLITVGIENVVKVSHSTVYPLRFNTVPCPSTIKAGPLGNLQSHRRLFWRVKTPPVLITSPVSIVDPHSPGFGWIDTTKKG